jgi:outer membrane protein
VTLHAQSFQSDDNAYSIRLGAGIADKNDLGDILLGDWNRYDKGTSVFNLDGGWRFVENMSDLPIDWYMKGGVSCYYENGYADNVWEANLYVKLYWKIDFLQNRVRLGLGEGLSLASDIPIVEVDDAEGDPKSKFLNYLDISADFDLGRLIRVESLRDVYLGYTIKHRSGIFGLFKHVHGGSNYNMLTIEKNF